MYAAEEAKLEETEKINKNKNSSGSELIDIKEKIRKWQKIANLVIGLAVSAWIFVQYSITLNKFLNTKYYVGYGTLESDSTITVDILIDYTQLSQTSQTDLENGDTVSLLKPVDSTNSAAYQYSTENVIISAESSELTSERNNIKILADIPSVQPTRVPRNLPTIAPTAATMAPTAPSGVYYQCYDMDGYSVHHGKQVATAWLDLSADDDGRANPDTGPKQLDVFVVPLVRGLIVVGLIFTGLALFAVFCVKLWKEIKPEKEEGGDYEDMKEKESKETQQKPNKCLKYCMDVFLILLPFMCSVLLIPLSSFDYDDGICLHSLEGLFMPMSSLIDLFTYCVAMMGLGIVTCVIAFCCPQFCGGENDSAAKAKENAKMCLVLWVVVFILLLIGQGILGFVMSTYQDIMSSLPNYIYSLNIAVNAILTAWYFVT